MQYFLKTFIDYACSPRKLLIGSSSHVAFDEVLATSKKLKSIIFWLGYYNVLNTNASVKIVEKNRKLLLVI